MAMPAPDGAEVFASSSDFIGKARDETATQAATT
jgi:hypothetical protein